MMLLQAAEVRKFYGAFCALDGVNLIISEGEHVLDHRAERRRKDHVGQRAHRLGAAERRHGYIQGTRHRPPRSAALIAPRNGALIPAGQHLSAAQRARDDRGRGHFEVSAWADACSRALRKNRGVWEIVERVAGLFGFSSKLEQPAKSLSQGDKKLLDVASAFALNPEIILLDEPTSGVSTAEKSTVMQVLVRAAKETGIKAIIQVEHDMDIVFGYSSRIIAVHDGKILADGSPEMIRARSDVMATVVGRP